MDASTTVLLVDASSRNINVYTCSATQLLVEGKRQLVLRKAVQVGDIFTITKKFGWVRPMYPIVVAGGYQAQSSAGFVRVMPTKAFEPIEWVGGTGWPFSLKKFQKPIDGYLIPKGAYISTINGMKHHSNHSTAKAALDGMVLRSECNDSSQLILATGRSDVTIGWAIFEECWMWRQKTSTIAAFPIEHRQDIFYSNNSKAEKGGPCSEG